MSQAVTRIGYAETRKYVGDASPFPLTSSDLQDYSRIADLLRWNYAAVDKISTE